MSPRKSRAATRDTEAPKLEPMYATIGREVPGEGDWVYEPKYDGVRVLGFVDRSGARLVTRNGKEKTEQFPEIVAALRDAGARGDLPLVVDGEVVAMRKGRPLRFQALQDRMHLRDPEGIREQAESSPAALIAFDLLHDGAESLVDRPWEERRAALERRLAGLESPRLLVTEVLKSTGEKSLEKAQRDGWEGVIAKRRGAPYRPGRRSDDWLKLKVEYRQEFVVGGWTEPQRTRPHLGSLLVGYYDGNQLVFAGGVGTGFNREGLRQMRGRLSALERETPPFAEPPRTRTTAHWVEPQVVVELRFTEWTADARLRQPVYLGVRDDKPAREVTRESVSVQRR